MTYLQCGFENPKNFQLVGISRLWKNGSKIENQGGWNMYLKKNNVSQFVKKVVKICLVIQELDIFITNNEKMLAVFYNWKHVLFRLAQPFNTCGHDETP